MQRVDGTRLVSGPDSRLASFHDPDGIFADDFETGDLSF